MKAPPDWLLIIVCVIVIAGLIELLWFVAATFLRSLAAAFLFIFYILLSAG